jgi:CheY-like chemotaxis protein
MHRMEQQPADVVIVALDLPNDSSAALLAALRERPEWECIPVLALAESAGQAQSVAARKAGFQDCQVKFDPEAMIESIKRLAAGPVPAETPSVLVETALVGAGEER